jgi:hypothetical protein
MNGVLVKVLEAGRTRDGRHHYGDAAVAIASVHSLAATPTPVMLGHTRPTERLGSVHQLEYRHGALWGNLLVDAALLRQLQEASQEAGVPLGVSIKGQAIFDHQSDASHVLGLPVLESIDLIPPSHGTPNAGGEVPTLQGHPIPWSCRDEYFLLYQTQRLARITEAAVAAQQALARLQREQRLRGRIEEALRAGVEAAFAKHTRRGPTVSIIEDDAGSRLLGVAA